MTMQERSDRRAAVRYPATLTLIDGTRLGAETVDISHGGISVLVATGVRLAQVCAIDIRLQFDQVAHQILAMGPVVYCEPAAGGGFRAGIQLIAVDPASAQVIERLLATVQA
jgi:c-di-GMP-binding flagellar brake protein YcgR